MSKYQPLALYLENQRAEIWDARFSDIERILGFALPRSAHQYAAWWANQDPGHSQTQGWRSAGWETSQVDLAAKQVRFRRIKGETGVTARTNRPDDSRAALLDRARKLSGIEDENALIDAALVALIRREATRQLAEIGGTMPDLAVPQRERPTW
jgi:hypothetical protein